MAADCERASAVQKTVEINVQIVSVQVHVKRFIGPG